MWTDTESFNVHPVPLNSTRLLLTGVVVVAGPGQHV